MYMTEITYILFLNLYCKMYKTFANFTLNYFILFVKLFDIESIKLTKKS